MNVELTQENEKITGPYWMLRNIVVFTAKEPCLRKKCDCEESGDCITEYCATCLARCVEDSLGWVDDPPEEGL